MYYSIFKNGKLNLYEFITYILFNKGILELNKNLYINEDYKIACEKCSGSTECYCADAKFENYEFDESKLIKYIYKKLITEESIYNILKDINLEKEFPIDDED